MRRALRQARRVQLALQGEAVEGDEGLRKGALEGRALGRLARVPIDLAEWLPQVGSDLCDEVGEGLVLVVELGEELVPLGVLQDVQCDLEALVATISDRYFVLLSGM